MRATASLQPVGHHHRRHDEHRRPGPRSSARSGECRDGRYRHCRRESKYHYQLWRPVTGIREADRGTGPSGLGDGNDATTADSDVSPAGAPASNLVGPDFTPPFPSYPSGHAGFGGAVFEVLRRFYGTDQIPFSFVSDEYNGMTRGRNGEVRPVHERSYASLSEAEGENGQSRIYLGIHWSFDKAEGIEQGRRVARYVMQNAFTSRRVRF